MRLTVVQRRLLTRTFLLGAVLTLGVMVSEWFGGLSGMEAAVYDRRARDCQWFNPPPAPELFHIQIDDQTLSEVGRWPWPRSKLAIVIDELKLAGSKVIALDMLLSEPQLPFSTRQPDGSYRDFDDDQRLAEAFARAGNVLLPSSAGQFVETTMSPLNEALLRRLREDLETSTESLQKKLLADGFGQREVEVAVREDLLFFQEQAMLQRLTELVQSGSFTREQIIQQVVPKAAASGQRSSELLLAEQKYAIVEAMQQLDRFQPAIPNGTPTLLRAQVHTMIVPVSKLTQAAAYSGYVDFVPEREDPIVRAVPLFSNFRGRLYPHMALATACAALDVPIDKIRIMSDRLVLPVPNADPIEIPTRTLNSAKFGSISTFLDLPWFGRSGEFWWNMYDYPNYLRAVQQEPLKNVWRVQQFRDSIERNEETALDAALLYRVTLNREPEAVVRSEWAAMTSDQKMASILAIVTDEFNAQNYDAAQAVPTTQRSEDERVIVGTFDALKDVLRTADFMKERIAAERKQLHGKLNGKIVMIGWTAAGQFDYYPTSLHPQCPGVVIQGVAVNAILSQQFWRVAPRWLSPVMTGLFGALVTLFVAFLPSYRALVAMLMLVGFYFVFNGIVLFDYGNWIVPAAGALTAAGVVWGILTLYRYIFESGEKARITKRFSGYVDPVIVNILMEDPDRVHFDGEVREMTVVFTDLAGFTTISEKLQERTVPLLNDYMSRMMPIIRRNRGTWNKFLGDGIMFFYNAPVDNPNHARDAVITILEMQREMEDFNKVLLEQKLPKVAMRAGVVTGNMIAGDAGSIGENHEASDYTVLGDNVNLAARLESANKAMGSRTLVVQKTVEMMGDDILYRPLARLQVVGKSEGVMTHEPMCLLAEATDAQKRLAALTKEIVDSFIARNFDAVIAAADRMQDEFGSSKLTALYLEQAREYLIAPPPDDWDGTIVLESK